MTDKKQLRGSPAHRAAVAYVQNQMRDPGYWQFGADDKVSEITDNSLEVAKKFIVDLFEPILAEHKNAFEKMSHDEKAEIWAEAFDFFLERTGLYITISLDEECLFQINSGINIFTLDDSGAHEEFLGRLLNERARIFAKKRSVIKDRKTTLGDLSADYKFTEFSDQKEVSILCNQFKNWLCKEYSVDPSSIFVGERPNEEVSGNSASLRESIRIALRDAGGDLDPRVFARTQDEVRADAVMAVLKDLGMIGGEGGR